MADYGRLLITKILDEDDIVPAMSAGIRPEWFDDTEHGEIFGWMLDYFSRYGKTPTLRALRKEFPVYRLSRSVAEPYDYYLDHFRDQRRRALVVEGMNQADQALQLGEVTQAQSALSQALIRADTEVTSLTDVEVTSDVWERFKKHREGRRDIVMTGVPTGFNSIDRSTGGFHQQQFILLGGLAKMGKSFMLMKSACAAQAAGKKVLFMTFEMSEEEQQCRYEALKAGVNAQHLINGSTTREELKALRVAYREIKTLSPLTICADISATTTVTALAAKIEQHRPDIIFVDGCYLMETNEQPLTPQHYTAISRGLKRLAQRTRLPVVATTQALESKMGKDRHVTMHSFGYSSAWSQDADLILGVEQVEGRTGLIRFRVVAGRNVSQFCTTLACDWSRSQLEEIDEPDETEWESESNQRGGGSP